MENPRITPKPVPLEACGDELNINKLREKIEALINNGELTIELGTEVLEAINKLDFVIAEPYDPTNEQGVDDPHADYNNISDIAWEGYGKIETVEDMARIINQDIQTGADKSAYLTVDAWAKSIVTFGIWPLGQRVASHNSTDMGNFSIAKIRNNFEAFTHGYKTLGLNSKWHSRNEIFDLEERNESPEEIQRTCIRTITPSHTLLRVPKGFIGVALLGRSAEDDGNRAHANDQDPVLFSQGKYLLREKDYHDISLAKIDSAQNKIPLGKVATILNIKPHQYGGAKRRGGEHGNRFVTWGPGRPIILDNKEWDDSFVINITPGVTEMATENTRYAQFILLERGFIAAVTTREGKHGLLTEPGLYQLLSDRFMLERTQYKPNQPSLDIGVFMIRTVDQDQMGVVQEVGGDGDYHLLLPGKYYLEKSDWINPVIKTLDQPEVTVGPWTFLTLTKDMSACAIDNTNGKRVIFDRETGYSTGQRLQLHRRQFPDIKQIPRNSTTLQEFGGEYVIKIPDGTFGMFELTDEIRAMPPGIVSVPIESSKFLHKLPSTSMILDIPNFIFKTANDMNMKLNANITMQIVDDESAVKVSRYIRANDAELTSELVQVDHVETNAENADQALSRVRQRRLREHQAQNDGFTFESVKASVINLTREKLTEKFKAYNHDDLIVVAGEGVNPQKVIENINKVEQETLEEISDFVFDTIGITVKGIKVLGGIEFNSTELINQFRQRALDREAVKTEQIRQEKNRAEAQAKAEVETVNARKEQEILTLQERSKLEREKIRLQIQAQNEEQQRDLQVKQKESDLRQKEMELNQRLAEVERTAEAEAKAITLRARAEHEREKLRNEAGKELPDQVFQLEALKLYNKALENIGQTAATMPDFYKAMIGMGMNSGSATGVKHDGNIGDMAQRLTYMNMAMGQLKQFQENVEQNLSIGQNEN